MIFESLAALGRCRGQWAVHFLILNRRSRNQIGNEQITMRRALYQHACSSNHERNSNCRCIYGDWAGAA